jgi:acyl-[acyl-carrier-protein]-phospholipid O-acyltransferase/long-chain-fatty-acid--[acyl-carrier-protein] ligase
LAHCHFANYRCCSASFVCKKKIPHILNGDKTLELEFKKYISFGYLKENLRISFSNKVILESILALAVFYATSQVLLATFGAHLKIISGETSTLVAQAIMAMAGVGIAIGAYISSVVSKHYIETGLLPISGAGMVASIFFILQTSSPILLGGLFLSFGIFGGFSIVILNSLIQYRAKEHELGRIMATSNFVQNILMLSFLALTMLSSLYDVTTTLLFTSMMIVLLVVTIYAIITLPQVTLRLIFKLLASFRYKLKTYGTHNFPKDGAALLLGNHVSYLDWLIIAMASPRRVSFVIDRAIYEKKILKPIFKFFGLIPISNKASKDAFKAIKQKLEQGKIVAFFPEGAITRNGHLGTLQRGFELILKDIEVPIVPFYIRGLWGSRFSYANQKQKRNVKNSPRVVDITFGHTLPSTTNTIQLKQAIQELSIQSWSEYIDTLKPIPNSWLTMAKFEGKNLSVADATGTKLSNHKLLAVVKSFSKKVNQISKDQQNIGIMMPSSVGGVIVNLSTLMLGKTVVNLNYTASATAINHSINLAQIKTIYTSKQFLTKLKAKGIDLESVLEDKNVIYLEDLKATINKLDIVKNLILAKFLPTKLLEALWIKQIPMDSVAAILFSSGSEGLPKGVELTHKNFMGNIKQFCNLLNFNKNDIIVSSLPTFHVFGLTVSTLAPLTEGVPFVCQPDPTDAQGMGELTATYKATMLFGTSTFFRIYAKNKKLHPLMFESIKFVVGGAERLSQDVRDSFRQKFGLNIYEAYGTTEATPGISANIPDVLNPEFWELQVGNKIGTVGLPFPGTLCKIVNPDTYEELPQGQEGMIIVGGTQVMKGYLKDEEKTNEVVINKDGIRWYITGDKGKLDSDGFLTIVDRYSRFAKIGGEMISLSSVEEGLREVLSEDIDIIATNIPDAKKGEKIVLLYNGEISSEEIQQKVKNSSLNQIMYPSIYHHVEMMPKLGSGKTDIKKAKKMALELDN